MKRILFFLLVLGLAFCACMTATATETDEFTQPPSVAEEPEAEPIDADEGDDSNPEPVDMMEEEELDSGEQILQGRVLHYGDDGDDD